MRLAKLKSEEGEKAARKVLSQSIGANVSDLLNIEEPEARRYGAISRWI